VDVASDAILFAANDQCDFAVGLQADKAEDDMHAAFSSSRDQRMFRSSSKAGLEFDYGRHLLAAVRRALQRPHDRRIARRAIESLLIAERGRRWPPLR